MDGGEDEDKQAGEEGAAPEASTEAAAAPPVEPVEIDAAPTESRSLPDGDAPPEPPPIDALPPDPPPPESPPQSPDPASSPEPEPTPTAAEPESNDWKPATVVFWLYWPAVMASLAWVLVLAFTLKILWPWPHAVPQTLGQPRIEQLWTPAETVKAAELHVLGRAVPEPGPRPWAQTPADGVGGLNGESRPGYDRAVARLAAVARDRAEALEAGNPPPLLESTEADEIRAALGQVPHCFGGQDRPAAAYHAALSYFYAGDAATAAERLAAPACGSHVGNDLDRARVAGEKIASGRLAGYLALAQNKPADALDDFSTAITAAMKLKGHGAYVSAPSKVFRLDPASTLLDISTDALWNDLIAAHLAAHPAGALPEFADAHRRADITDLYREAAALEDHPRLAASLKVLALRQGHPDLAVAINMPEGAPTAALAAATAANVVAGAADTLSGYTADQDDPDLPALKDWLAHSCHRRQAIARFVGKTPNESCPAVSDGFRQWEQDSWTPQLRRNLEAVAGRAPTLVDKARMTLALILIGLASVGLGVAFLVSRFRSRLYDRQFAPHHFRESRRVYGGVRVSLLAAEAVLALLFAAAAIAPRWGGWKSGVCVTIAGLASLVFALVAIAAAHGQFGELRLSLQTVSYTRAALRERAISLGGDAAVDDILGDGLPGRAAVIAGDGAGVRVTAPPPQAGPEALVEVGDQVLGTLPVTAGAAICLGGADGRTHAIRLNPGAGQLSLDGVGAGRPRMALSPGERWTSRVFPIRLFAAGKAADLETAPLAGLKSVLIARDGWRLATLDPNVWVAPGGVCGMRPRPGPAPTATIAAGQAVKVRLDRISYGETWLARDTWGKADPPRSRLIPRRGVTLWADPNPDGRLVLTLAEPEAFVIAHPDLAAALAAARSEGEDRLRLAFGDLGATTQGTELSVIRYHALGQPVLRRIVERFEIADDDGAPIIAGEAGAATTAAFGKVQSLGDQVAMGVKVERIDLGWTALRGVIGVLIAGVLASLGGGFAWRRASPIAFIVLTSVDFLLVLRLLIAVEGAVIDPRPVTAAIPGHAMVTLLCAPLLLLALAPRRWLDLRRVGAQMAVTVGGCGFLALTGRFVVLDGFLPTTDALLAAIALAAMTFRMVQIVRSAATAPAASPPLAGLSQRIAAVARRPWVTPAALAVVTLGLLGLRIGLALAGIGERSAKFGALSVFYTPLMIAVGAWAIVWGRATLRAFAARPVRWRPTVLAQSLGVSLLVLAALLAPPFGAVVGGDNGYLIHLGAAMAALALAVFWPDDAGVSVRAWLGGPAAVMAAVAVVGGATLGVFGGHAAAWPDPSDNSRAADTARLQIVEDSARAGRVNQRLWAFFQPERLQESGTRGTEQLVAALAEMRDYASQGALGRGYLNQPDPGQLRRYHLDDNVSIVHIATPFGVLSLDGLVLLMGVMAGGCAWRLAAPAVTERGSKAWSSAPAPPLDWPLIFGLFCLITVFVIDAYMALANLQVMPFTGRNLYFLAALSFSDVVEASLLFGAALLVLARRPA